MYDTANECEDCEGTCQRLYTLIRDDMRPIAVCDQCALRWAHKALREAPKDTRRFEGALEVVEQFSVKHDTGIYPPEDE